MAQQKKIPHGATGVHRRPAGLVKRRKLPVATASAGRFELPPAKSPGEQMVDSIKRASERRDAARLNQITDVSASQQRQRRDRLPNETRGKGDHFGKTLTHSQIVQPTNATAANRPRVDFGRTRDLSSSGGNPANVNHRPFNRQRGTTAQSVQARREEMFLSGVTAKASQYIKS